MTATENRWAAELETLLHSGALHSAESVLTKPSPVPAAGGAYAWYFQHELPGVPLDGVHVRGGWHLLYVGISPKAPSQKGSPSRQTIRRRIRSHYRGNASTSTLRLTLGCLLADELRISLRRVGGGSRLTFRDGEADLSNWMAAHARVVWVVAERQWELEHDLIRSLKLPLNLGQNRHSAFHARLSDARSAQRAAARAFPVMN